MPGGAEVVSPAARAADVLEVHAISELARLVGRLSGDFSELDKVADVGEHFCKKERDGRSNAIKILLCSTNFAKFKSVFAMSI